MSGLDGQGLIFCRSRKRCHFPCRARSLSREMCPTDFFGKVWGRSNTWGNFFEFARVLKRRSFCRSGPEACHKKCAQGTFWKKRGAGPRPGGTYLIFVGSWKGDHFAAQAPKPVTRNVPKEHLGKSGEQFQDLGGLIWFLSGLEKEVILQGRPVNLSQEMCPRNILEKVGSRSNIWGDLFDFCGVLKGGSFCRSGPEAYHKTCGQGTFWEKWGAGPTPGGAYLICVGSWKGAHFAGQVQKPVTRNVSKEHCGKVESRSNTGGWPTCFSPAPGSEVISQDRPQNLSQEMCPKNILEGVGSRSSTWWDLSDFCRVLTGRSFCRSGPETCHNKCAQGTFWKKCGAGPTPGGTYLICVGF